MVGRLAEGGPAARGHLLGLNMNETSPPPRGFGGHQKGNAEKAPRDRLRVLVVEDRPDDAELVLMELRRGGFDVVHERVDTAAALTAALTREKWDLVLSDFSMPSFSGPAALELVRGLSLDIPFIIVSGTVGEGAAVEAMRSGANDYVFKGSLGRLCPAIDRELREAGRRAGQRTLQEQLLISDRMASVGTLAAGVAHEINNPLASVLANLELMTRDLGRMAVRLPLDDGLAEVLDELRDARESADRIRHIVRDLKIFSRAADEERRGPVDVNRVLESSLRMAWNEIRHRARLVKEYTDVPAVEGNEARLGQVFLNLVVNAAQSIPEGNADRNVIRVSTALDAASERVVVEVRDSGSGIAREHLPRIFDAFFTTKPVGVGTGLGLSICHRIVTGLGGDIRVESEEGLGTSFRVLLTPTREEVQAIIPVSAPERSIRRGKVLVVDDEPMIGRAIKRALQQDHDVSLATSAGEAWERVTSGERFDVILCDLMMPQMTGMELHAELLGAVPEQASVMVFLTGGAFTPGARAFLDGIANQRIDKPFDAQHIRAIVGDRIK